MAPMSCTSLIVYYCIFLNFVFGGMSATLVTDHGTMFRLMFGQTRATRPPRRKVCALCCHKRSTVTFCDECKEHCCFECIDTHTCRNSIICYSHSK